MVSEGKRDGVLGVFSRLPSSAWKDSSFDRSVEFRTHDSEDRKDAAFDLTARRYRVKQLSSQWKKNALRSLLIFFMIDVLLDVNPTTITSISNWCWIACVEVWPNEKTAHFSDSFRPLDWVKVSTVDT